MGMDVDPTTADLKRNSKSGKAAKRFAGAEKASSGSTSSTKIRRSVRIQSEQTETTHADTHWLDPSIDVSDDDIDRAILEMPPSYL